MSQPANARSTRILLGAFGDPGHAFPMIALGSALAMRGHAVTLQTWRRWRDDVEAAGMRFAAAPEYQVFPTRARPLKPYQAAVRAAVETRPLVAETRPDAVVADILTLAPALAGANPHVFVETDRGTLDIELLPSEAPVTVAAFLDLVERRFFDGTRWHRVVPNFVVQDGDPRGDGWGGPGFVLRDEINPVRYETGTVGMALSGPDTGGSQYFITHSAQPHLDGIYTIFGRVIGGSVILDAIGQGDRIRSIHR